MRGTLTAPGFVGSTEIIPMVQLGRPSEEIPYQTSGPVDRVWFGPGPCRVQPSRKSRTAAA